MNKNSTKKLAFSLTGGDVFEFLHIIERERESIFLIANSFAEDLLWHKNI